MYVVTFSCTHFVLIFLKEFPQISGSVDVCLRFLFPQSDGGDTICMQWTPAYSSGTQKFPYLQISVICWKMYQITVSQSHVLHKIVALTPSWGISVPRNHLKARRGASFSQGNTLFNRKISAFLVSYLFNKYFWLGVNYSQICCKYSSCNTNTETWATLELDQ